MRLEYCCYTIKCKTVTPFIEFRNMPGFVFHSMLGKELHRIACFRKGERCENCAVRFACPYGRLFVTFMRKDENALAGCDRATHPFVLWCDAPLHRQVAGFTLHLLLPREVAAFFSYFFYALKAAGERGLFKERIKYEITAVECDGKPLMQNKILVESSDFAGGSFWLQADAETPVAVDLYLKTLSPLRIKYDGRLQKELTPLALLRAVQRRANQFCALYGELIDPVDFAAAAEITVQSCSDDPVQWQDFTYRSSQKSRPLQLGGLTGTLHLTGTMPAGLRALLDLGAILHIGKNTGFGLGRYQLIDEKQNNRWERI